MVRWCQVTLWDGQVANPWALIFMALGILSVQFRLGWFWYSWGGASRRPNGQTLAKKWCQQSLDILEAIHYLVDTIQYRSALIRMARVISHLIFNSFSLNSRNWFKWIFTGNLDFWWDGIFLHHFSRQPIHHCTSHAKLLLFHPLLLLNFGCCHLLLRGLARVTKVDASRCWCVCFSRFYH